jgi:hypothetical protein
MPAMTRPWPRSKPGKRLWHVFVQILCFYKKPPELRLTESAKRELLLSISRTTDFDAVASVLWGSTVVDGVARKPNWSVGFYDKGTRPYGRVTAIQGVPFVFVQDRAHTHLNGATLDYRGGRFVVDEGTPPA